MLPKVSIVITTYNKERYVAETLNSALRQTYKNTEVLLVDDASTDNTKNVLNSVEGIERCKLVLLEQNSGANYCRNKGIELASGEYLMFLDGDDVLLHSCVEERIKQALENKEYDLLVFPMGVFYSKIGDDNRVWQPTSKQALNDFLSHKLPWAIVQPLWKRSCLLKSKGFDVDFKRLQDVELHTRVLLELKASYKMFKGAPDCFYRIDDARKNGNAFQFMERWVHAARQYCSKFSPLIEKSKRYLLLGTVIHTYLNLLHAYKQQRLSNSDYSTLKKSVEETVIDLFGSSKGLFICFKILEAYNLQTIRIPGINRILAKCILALGRISQ